MENFNTIPSAGTYGSAIALINANFSLTKEQLERLSYSREGFCGMYDTPISLGEAYPNPTTGSFAYVGTSFPMDVYTATNGVWAKTIEDGYSGGGIDLTQYADKASLTALVGRVTALENAGYVFIGIATPAGAPSPSQAKRFALAWAAGTYTYYGGFVLNSGEMAVLMYNGSAWSGTKTDIIAKGVVGGYDTTPTEDSEKPITSGGVYTAMDELRSDMEDELSNVDMEFGSGEYVSDVIIHNSVGQNESVLLTQGGITSFVFNEIDINDIDNLNNIDYAYSPSQSQSKKTSYYTVVTFRGTSTTQKVKIGTMAVISDGLARMVTEVMTTRYTLDASGNLTCEFSNNDVFTIYRSTSGNTWTQWHYVNESIWTEAISGIRTDLTNYYTKSQTYSKTEVDNLIAAINQFNYVVAPSLPTPTLSTMGVIYLIPSAHSVSQNVKDEFITIREGNGFKWEQIGSTAVDLSGYSTTAEMNTAINAAIASALISYYTKTQVDTLLDEKQNVIDDLATIRSGAAAGATAVQPGDMNSAISSVRASIGYYECSTAVATAAKVVSASGYTLTNGGCIRIKMANANTAANVTLNINSTGAKALFYDGAQASSANTWEAGEVLEVYYDGTQYQCASGGGGKFATGEKVKEMSVIDSESDMSGMTEEQKAKTVITANMYDAIKSLLQSSTTLSTTWTNGSGINPNTGNLENNSYVAHSDYIDIHSFDNVSYQLLEASSKSGVAFYNQNKQYISGYVKPSDNTWSWQWRTQKVENGIYYMRLTSPSSTSGHTDMGNAQVIGYSVADFLTPSDIADSLEVTDAGFALDARQGKVLLDLAKDGTYNVLDFGWTNGGGIRYNTGNIENPSGVVHILKYSDYIDIAGFNLITTKLIGGTSVYGIAFYNSNKTYISGVVSSQSTGGYDLQTIDIPTSAEYVRITGYQDETTYGQQIMVLSKTEDSNLVEVPLSFFISDSVGGWWRIPSGQFVSATNYATNRSFVEKGADMIIAGDEGYLLTVQGKVSGLLTQLDANGNPTNVTQQYSSSKKIKAGYEWNVQLRYSVLADITDFNEIVSHFTVRMSMADFLMMLEDKTREMKMANPYYDTFASFNESASTQLVKETIFGTTIDGGGGSTRRIPSVILTNSGKVIAATEVRSAYADNAQTGIIVARKALDGDTWTYNLVLPYNAATYGKVMNPSFVVDRTGTQGTAGRVYLFFLAFPITSTNNGYAKDATTAEMDCMYIYSDNDGETWSSPVSVKSGWDTTEWTWIGVSPSNGVQMSDGTFVFPCMGRYNSQWYSGVMWKTPSGSWQFSKRSEFINDNESCIFVYEGNIYLNCRNEDTGNTRTLYKLNTSDGVLSSVQYKYVPNVVCQQSISQGTIDGATIYIQTANDPIVYNTRNRLTLFVSPDGMQWYRMIRVNDATTYGYSVADTYNGNLVIVYENSGTISYINLTPVVPAIDTTHDRAFGKNEEERMQQIVERLL